VTVVTPGTARRFGRLPWAMLDLTPLISIAPYIALLVALALIPAAYR
jgi:hypothetical protein